MNSAGKTLRCIVYAVFFALAFSPSVACAQTTQITTEYFATVYVPLDPVQPIGNQLRIWNVRAGSWVKGPKINGTFIAPCGDWVQVMPDGKFRPDCRCTVKTDDGALIYWSQNGVISYPKESLDRLMKGELLTSKGFYYIMAPTMRTSSEKYAWINNFQFVGKAVELKVGKDAFVKFDIFVLR